MRPTTRGFRRRRGVRHDSTPALASSCGVDARSAMPLRSGATRTSGCSDGMGHQESATTDAVRSTMRGLVGLMAVSSTQMTKGALLVATTCPMRLRLAGPMALSDKEARPERRTESTDQYLRPTRLRSTTFESSEPRTHVPTRHLHRLRSWRPGTLLRRPAVESARCSSPTSGASSSTNSSCGATPRPTQSQPACANANCPCDSGLAVLTFSLTEPGLRCFE
jgi:hypothetical protein